jgi:hypothetical protein
MRTLCLVLVLLFYIGSEGYAQCAMCRATVETNLSTGEGRIGLGLNTGILYLMSMPYIALAVLGYFWYKHSKRNHAQTLKVKRILTSKMSPLP